MHRTLLRLLTIATTLSCASAAHAAGWVSSGPLSPADRVAIEPQIVLTPSGERVIAWVQELGDGSAIENVSVRLAPPGGDFGATQTFAGRYADVQLAAGTDGTVALVWEDLTNHSVRVARRAPGQTSFVEATPVVMPGGEFPANVHISVTGGDVYVSFDSSDQNASSSIWAARLAAGAGALQIVPGTATGGAIDHRSFTSGQPRAFVDGSEIAADRGQVYVAWEDRDDGSGMNPGTTSIKYAKLTGAGTFGAPVTVDFVVGTSTSAPGTSPVIAAGAGHAYVVWQRSSDGLLELQDVAKVGAVLSVSVDPTDITPFAAVDGSGSLTIAGQGFPVDGSGSVVYAVSVAADASPGPAVRLSPHGIQRQLEALAVSSDGTALVVLDREPNLNDEIFQIQSALRPAGNAFPASEDVSGIQDGSHGQQISAAAAAAPGGRALVLWPAADHSGNRNLRLHLSERDATPPLFTAVNVPATATVGQSMPMSAAATDALSGNATISWDFGDGSQAAGAGVSHVFGLPGAATVTVTATDSVGNSITQTRVVAVAPAGAVIDRTAPVITRLRLSNGRFRVGPRATAQLAAKRKKRKPAPTGSTLRLTLSERATLAIAISRSVHRRSVLVGMLVRASAGPGPVTVAFSGRIGHAALAPGSYTAAVTAIDGSGNRSRPATVTFTIIG